MDNSFQTSFIPKKPITSSSVEKAPKSLLLIVAIFLVIVSGLVSAGLFLYKNYLTKQKEISSAALLKIRDSFEKDTIEELDLFNQKTEVAKQILSNHIVLSPLFNVLEEITIPQVQYNKFEQKTDTTGNFMVSIQGVARDYRSIALQADMFNSAKGSSFKNVIFSNLTKDEKNNKINFNLEFAVDSNLLSYEKNSLLSSGDNTPSDSLSPNLENPTQ